LQSQSIIGQTAFASCSFYNKFDWEASLW